MCKDLTKQNKQNEDALCRRKDPFGVLRNMWLCRDAKGLLAAVFWHAGIKKREDKMYPGRSHNQAKKEGWGGEKQPTTASLWLDVDRLAESVALVFAAFVLWAVLVRAELDVDSVLSLLGVRVRGLVPLE